MKTVKLEDLVGSVVAVFIDEAPEMDIFSEEARKAAEALRDACKGISWTEEFVEQIGRRMVDAIDAANADGDTEEEQKDEDA